MKTVRYRCKKCGFSEECTRKELFFRNAGIFFLTFFAGIGVIVTVWMLWYGMNPFLTLVTDAAYIEGNAAEDASLRSLALNMTQSCASPDSICYARGVFEGTKGLHYVPDSLNGDHIYDPVGVWRAQAGDCKAESNLYRALLNSVGIRASIISNEAWHHTIAIVPNYLGDERTSGYIVVDLTMPYAVLMKDGQDPWTYLNQTNQTLRW